MIKLIFLLSVALAQTQKVRVIGPVDSTGALYVNCVNCPSGEGYGASTQGPGADGGINWGVHVANWQTTQAVTGGVTARQGYSFDGGYTWPIEGSVSVSNLPTTQAVSGPLTDTQLRAAAVPVSGTFWQSTQPVSVATMPSTPVTGTFWPATQPVSGTVGATQSTGEDGGRAWNVAGTVAVSNLPATQAVTGTFWQATQPVSGSVSVSNFPATQPVSGTLTCSGPLTDTQLRSTPVPVSGTVTATANQSGTWTVQPGNTANTTAWKVDGSAVTQPVSGTVTATANQNGTWTVQPGNTANTTAWLTRGDYTTGKTNTMKTATLATTATTADQVLLTYTVTSGKTFYLQYLSVNSRLTTFAATATLFGECSLESPAGTKLVTTMLAGSGIGDRDYLPFTEPVPIAAGVVVRIVCTPAATTAFTFRGNFGGYER